MQGFKDSPGPGSTRPEVFLEQCSDPRSGQCFREQIALDDLCSPILQNSQLRIGLDTLHHHFQSELVRQPQRCPDDRVISVTDADFRDELLGYLDAINREAAKIVEG